jgi:hypothetical protein
MLKLNKHAFPLVVTLSSLFVTKDLGRLSRISSEEDWYFTYLLAYLLSFSLASKSVVLKYKF